MAPTRYASGQVGGGGGTAPARARCSANVLTAGVTGAGAASERRRAWHRCGGNEKAPRRRRGILLAFGPALPALAT